MPRTPTLPDGFHSHDFEKSYKSASNPREKMRLLGFIHLQAGETYTEIGRLLRVRRQTVADWLINFIIKGFEGLKDAPRSGPLTKLHPGDELCFLQAVIELQEKREGGRSIGEDIREMLLDRFGAEYTLSGTYDLLKRLGIVWITARPKHPKSDPKVQEEFKKKFAAEIKKVLPENIMLNQVDTWFQDEARVGQQGTVSRIWAIKGTRTRVAKQQQFISAYIFGAFCPARDEGVGLVMPNVNTESMQLHLEAISDRVPEGRHAVVVLDQAAWHTTDKLNVPKNVSLLHLPPYSPELNPAERVWEDMRKNDFHNRCYEGFDHIVDACCTAWNSMAGKVGHIKSLCSWAWNEVTVPG